MKFNGLRRVSALCVTAFALASVAQASSINGQVHFTGGILGAWSVGFSSSDPALELQQLVITLPATYFFDTQAGGFGYLTSQDFQKTGGGATATGLTPNTTASRDGAGALAIVFSGFNAASGAFTFDLDVDGTANLTPLQSCAGKTGFQLVQCNLTNAGITVANAALATEASSVNGSEIGGAQIALTFGGGSSPTTTLHTTLAQTAFFQAQGNFSAVPEPSSYALMGSGLAGLLWLARRRRSS
ncbi:PEP-CTERM sorting domain-containing protein [Paludibaculum fermentans]|uniref:PEP-CTERM sorting domain-containing protein n=1 Tax=Paludibaculum fermentans TaxID=1473598 RepID=UPI003EC10A44